MTPAQVVSFPKSAASPRPRHRGSMTFLTPEEMLALLKAAREHSIRAWAMILLAYCHGMRASEVCGLKLADVDLKAGCIVIRRLKGSLQTTQPLFPHRGQPLLDECAAPRAWLRVRHADGAGIENVSDAELRERVAGLNAKLGLAAQTWTGKGYTLLSDDRHRHSKPTGGCRNWRARSICVGQVRSALRGCRVYSRSIPFDFSTSPDK